MRKLPISTIIIVAIGVAAVIFAMQHRARQPIETGSTDFNRIESGATNSSSSVGTASTQVLAAGAVSSYCKLTNLGPGIVYCAVGATSTVNTGIPLNPMGTTTVGFASHVFDDTNLPVQAVNCITAATSTLALYCK